MTNLDEAQLQVRFDVSIYKPFAHINMTYDFFKEARLMTYEQLTDRKFQIDFYIDPFARTSLETAVNLCRKEL